MTETMTQEEIAVYYNLLPDEVKNYAKRKALEEETRCVQCKLLTDARTGYIHTTSKGCVISICRVCYWDNYKLAGDMAFIDWNGAYGR